MEELVPPSSPGMPPIGISECLEELLKFTLTSSINETLEIDMGLSKDYCSNLIKNDPSDITSDNTDSLEGVPSYPLYKRLALALHQSISAGALLKTNNKTVLVYEDYSWKQKEDEWNKLVLDKGSEIVNVLTNIHFELHVQEPFFSELKDGLKTIEGRCATGNYNLIRPGALILFNKCVVLEVQDVRCYPSFSKMLEAEILAEVLPGIKTIEEGVQIYRKFYSEEKERSNGVLAICVAKPATQPYISLASILSGLSYGGVQRLLGLMHTEGTIPEALPPSRSTLLSSFMLPYNLNVKGSTLTHGARALAKHANRSSDNYWGSFGGSVHRISRAIYGRWSL